MKTDEGTMTISVEEFETLQSAVAAVQDEVERQNEKLAEKDKQIAERDKQISDLKWTERAVESEGGTFCKGCFKRNMAAAVLIGGYVVMMANCAIPAKAAAANSPPLLSLLAEQPDAKERFQAHHLGRHHCEGALIFTRTNFLFECFGNADKNFTVERNTVAAIDENGVQLLGGAKFHFNIKGLKDDGVHNLFSEWIETTAQAKRFQFRHEASAVDNSRTAKRDDWHEFVPPQSVEELPELPIIDPPEEIELADVLPPDVPVAALPHLDPPQELGPWDQLRLKLAGVLGGLPRLGLWLAAFLVVPVGVAGTWSFRFLKYRQPWREWTIYKAFMAAKEAFDDRN